MILGMIANKQFCRFIAVGCVVTFSLVATSVAGAQQALRSEEDGGFFRRVLSLPDSKLYETPDATGTVVEENLPAFSIFYVFGEKLVRGDNWIEVGRKPDGGGIGWLPAAQAENWKSMLVMQYAPRGQRDRVMFFDNDMPLLDLVDGLNRPREVARLRERATAVLDGVGSGSGSGVSDRADIPVVALEPETPVDERGRPYLMPILDFHPDQEFDTGDYTTLVEVGSLNAPSTPAAAGDGPMAGGGAGEDGTGREAGDAPAVPELRDFKMGIVFVIDTTRSMGPYIDRTYETVRGVYEQFEAAGTLDRVAFGVVGYRDYLGYDPQIGYVTKVFQDLSPDAPPETILQNIQRVEPAKVPTDGWNEDAYAGLHVAINDLNWRPFDHRMIVLMTDAGARDSHDRHASRPNFGPETITELADRNGITIFPIHLRTSEAARVGNLGGAERQFRSIARTGDPNVEKYVGVDSGSLGDFGRFVDDFANQVRIAAEGAAQGRMMSEERPPMPHAGDREELPQPEETPPDDYDQEDPPSTELGQMLVNEIFRAQLEYIGRERGQAAPSFYRAWASDRDLSRPAYDALEVSVFLNRNQLNALAQALRGIVDRAKAADLDPGSFFDMLQSLAATMEHDPESFGAAGTFDNLADSGLLPDYLDALPYHSKVLRVDKRLWLDWGLTGQQEFIHELEEKLFVYESLYQDTDNWKDLGAGEPGLEVYPIPLRYLP